MRGRVLIGLYFRNLGGSSLSSASVSAGDGSGGGGSVSL